MRSSGPAPPSTTRQRCAPGCLIEASPAARRTEVASSGFAAPPMKTSARYSVGLRSSDRAHRLRTGPFEGLRTCLRSGFACSARPERTWGTSPNPGKGCALCTPLFHPLRVPRQGHVGLAMTMKGVPQNANREDGPAEANRRGATTSIGRPFASSRDGTLLGVACHLAQALDALFHRRVRRE